MRYDDAVASLFQAPLDQFVAERKQLAGELKAAGDKAGAAKLAKLARPPISAWVVNQLWWHARDAFDALFETAQRLRDGKLEATAAHREAIAKLRARAAAILSDAEHGAIDATLRRVTQTLSALAATGGWDPDVPGALSADRDPPGFEAIGISNVIALPITPALKPVTPAAGDGDDTTADTTHDDDAGASDDDDNDNDNDDDDDDAARDATDLARQRRAAADAEAAHQRREAAEHQRRRELEAAAARADGAAALRRAEAERAKAAAERHRIEAALRTAQGDVAQRERDVARLERDLAAARSMVEQARAVVHGLEERLAQLDN
jgi:hypothetical protein